MKIKDIIFQISDMRKSEVLEYLAKKAQEKGKKTFVVTVNSEIIMLARNNPRYENVIKNADLALLDGVGVMWAGKVFGKKFNGRSHGADLVAELSEFVAKKPITVGLLGGKENVALLTAECLRKKFPDLNVAFSYQEWPQDPKACDILYVAFGSPKQELWISENLSNIDAKVVIGVGGAFDFITGKVKRAPEWIRSLGLEWLFRLIIEPWRIKRQLRLPVFVILVLKEKIFG